MATPEHLLQDWDEFEQGAILHSFVDGDPSNRAPENFHVNNSYNYQVADWRAEKPIFNEEFCIHCQFCWIYCPDTAIIAKDKKFGHVDYDHCKGCGICVEVCPTNPKSLLMFNETKKDEDCLNEWPEKESGKDD
jgi:pyruvate ferredoxin oxidoreductase delta subunit